MRNIVLIIHNVRSAHNVGSLLRTADGLGIEMVIISGFSPYPAFKGDSRLPHIASKVSRSITKTSLGAEASVSWTHVDDLNSTLADLSANGYLIAALEQTKEAVDLSEFKPPAKIALIVGNEIEGLDPGTLQTAKVHLMIPMLGNKESFNVSVAGAMALYRLRCA
jgi:tRNA G18 (ribose-2'-O)-methylase SpoU